MPTTRINYAAGFQIILAMCSLKRKDLAAMIDKTPELITAICTGKSKPSLNVIELVANALRTKSSRVMSVLEGSTFNDDGYAELTWRCKHCGSKNHSDIYEARYLQCKSCEIANNPLKPEGITKMTGTRVSKAMAMSPTRNQFVCMDFFDINAGLEIRSLDIVKWIVEPLDVHDIDSLPKMNRADFSTTKETKLPPIFVINRARRPFCVIREV